MLSSFGQVVHIHHIVSIDFLCSSCHNICVVDILHSWHLWCNSNILLTVDFIFFPVDLKFGYSWLLNKNMSRKFVHIWDSRWVFNKFWKLVRISIVHIVTNSKEFLVVVIRTCQQNSCDTNDVVCLEFGNIWWMALL